MGFSLKSLTKLAKSPQGKKVVDQARGLDTPENRKKAIATFNKMRGGKTPPTGR